jgi:hypothetical protein
VHEPLPWNLAQYLFDVGEALADPPEADPWHPTTVPGQGLPLEPIFPTYTVSTYDLVIHAWLLPLGPLSGFKDSLKRGKS